MRPRRLASLHPKERAALLGLVAEPAPAPVDPVQGLVDKYDLNNPVKRMIVAVGLIGGFMGILRVKSMFS